MATRYRTEDKERGLLADAWEYVRLSQGSYDVRISCELRPSPSRGVWELHWSAKAEHQNGGWVIVCAYTVSFPSAQHSTLAGALMRGSLELDRLVDGWALGLKESVNRADEQGG